MVRSRTILLGAVLLGALSGCGEATKPRVTDVQFSIFASPDQSSPPDSILFRAIVTNAGTTQVLHCQGCGCGNGIHMSVLGPDGLPVLIEDPNRIRLECPDTFVPLEMGRSLVESDFFTGTLYVQNVNIPPTPTYQAPSGTYTVVARFGYSTSAALDAPWTSVERRATFKWVGGAAASAP